MRAINFIGTFKHIPVTLRDLARSSSLYLDANPRVLRPVELGAVAIIVIASLYAAFPTLHGMATNSLWLDEIVSITEFSAKGPINVITNYRQPNNHVLFNLLNSLSPWPDRFMPILGRFWSFAAVFGAFVITWLFFARRKLLFEGSLVIFAICINHKLLELVLQGRGYGITLCCALLSGLCCISYFEKPGWKPICLLSLATAAGTWCIPLYVLYGGGLMLFLLVVSKDLRWVTAGTATIFLIFILYSPVLWQMGAWYEWMQTRNRRDYGTIASVLTTFRDYLFCARGADWQLFLALGFATTFFPLMVRPQPFDRAVVCLLLACTAYLAASLYIENTFLRTTSFAIVPFLFLYVLLISKIVRGTSLSISRPFVISLLSIIALSSAFFWLDGPRKLVPIENWTSAAHFIETNLRPGVGISGEKRTQKCLWNYLDRSYPPVSFDNAAFALGKSAHLSFVRFDRGFSPSSLPLGYVEKSFAQQRGGKLTLYYMPLAARESSAPLNE